ncbi:MAG: hypothetical protein ACHBN1_09510 [Heteroscytonema crispum UTEX LB 1556]
MLGGWWLVIVGWVFASFDLYHLSKYLTHYDPPNPPPGGHSDSPDVATFL